MIYDNKHYGRPTSKIAVFQGFNSKFEWIDQGVSFILNILHPSCLNPNEVPDHSGYPII